MLVVLTEEPSMKAALEILLPKIGVTAFQIIPHQGVSDLEKSLPRKLRAWRDPSARFLVLRDNDGGDCHVRKQKLLAIAKDAGKEEKTLVRIVCQELEAWFVGDIDALRSSGVLTSRKVPAGLNKTPDDLPHPSKILKTLKPDYQKIAGAALVAAHMDPDKNRSESFQQTMNAATILST